MIKQIVKIKIDPRNINFFNRIMEGYEYLGTVTTLDRKEGIVIVRTTPDLYDEVIEIINHLEMDVSYLPEEM